jgi:hypothetical protein
VGCVVDKVARVRFSPSASVPLSILVPPTATHSSSEAGTTDQLLATVLSGLSLTPQQEAN